MEKMLKGNVYDLAPILEIEGYCAYLLERRSGFVWEEMCRVNLGRKRILHTDRDLWLILQSEDGIRMEKMSFPERYDFSKDPNGEHHPTVNLVEMLREKGLKCRTTANYDTRFKTKIEPAWRHALHSSWGMFSENGYALQFSGWLDYTYYQFEMWIVKKGGLVIGEHDIEGVRVWNVTEDVMEKAEALIRSALEEKHCITEEVFTKCIKECGLWEMQPWIEIYERD